MSTKKERVTRFMIAVGITLAIVAGSSASGILSIAGLFFVVGVVMMCVGMDIRYRSDL